MENEPKTIYLLTHDLEETDLELKPTDNDFDTIDGENVLWCANEVGGMNNIKYIHHLEVDRLIELAVNKALEVASESITNINGVTILFSENEKQSILSLAPHILKELNKDK